MNSNRARVIIFAYPSLTFGGKIFLLGDSEFSGCS
jgi:hypothetical protein